MNEEEYKRRVFSKGNDADKIAIEDGTRLNEIEWIFQYAVNQNKGFLWLGLLQLYRIQHFTLVQPTERMTKLHLLVGPGGPGHLGPN